MQGGEFECRRNVLRFQIQIVGQDLVAACSSGKEIEDVLDAYSKSANAWSSAVLIRSSRDAMQFVHEFVAQVPEQYAPTFSTWMNAIRLQRRQKDATSDQDWNADQQPAPISELA